MEKKNGFTIVEVLIVIVLLAALIAIGLPGIIGGKPVVSKGEKPVVDTGGKEFGIVVGYAQGKLDGYEYTYYRVPESYCKLVLKKEPNKSEILIYDTGDNGTIGDNCVDEYAIEIGDFGITYTRDYAAIRNKWEGRIIPRKEALEEATNTLRIWRKKIEFIHGCK